MLANHKTKKVLASRLSTVIIIPGLNYKRIRVLCWRTYSLEQIVRMYYLRKPSPFIPTPDPINRPNQKIASFTALDVAIATTNREALGRVSMVFRHVGVKATVIIQERDDKQSINRCFVTFLPHDFHGDFVNLPYNNRKQVKVIILYIISVNKK